MRGKGKSSGAAGAIAANPIFWFAIALGFGDGCVRNFVPATFPIFHLEMGTSLDQMGETQFLFYLSSLIFAIVGGPVLATIGLNWGAAMAVVMAAISLLFIGFAHQFGIVLVATAVLGFAIVAMVVIVSSIITANFSEQRQSIFLLSGLSDASGSMVGPAVLGWWIVHSVAWRLSWRSGYFAASAALTVLIVGTLFIRLGDNNSILKSGRLKGVEQVMSHSAFYIAVALCFCHGLAQAGMVSFVGQLYIKKLQVDAAHAAYLLSLEAVGILSGRLIFGALLSRFKIPELLMIGLCGAAEATAFAATIISSAYFAGASMFLLAGFFMSAIGPSLNSYLGGRFKRHASSAFALFAGLGNIGAALGPFLIGKAGTDFGIEHGIFLAPVSAAVLSSIAIFWHLREKRSLISTLKQTA